MNHLRYITCLCLFVFGIGAVRPVSAQNARLERQQQQLPQRPLQPATRVDVEGLTAPRPLREVLASVATQFGVRISYKRCDPDTLMLAYAAARVRPYALAETLDGLLHPLDLVWREHGTTADGTPKIVVQPFEFYRRSEADGARLLAWLSAAVPDLAAWEVRREQLLAEVRRILNLEPLLAARVATPDVRLGKPQRFDGYTTTNYALETLPGLYACGTIYAPTKVRRGTKSPLIVSPSGHWEGGRYRSDQQIRMATFARMGAVAVDLDIVGWGDSERQLGRAAHERDYAMQLQVLFAKSVLDWLLDTRNDIDPARIAATGGSGGATHALMLAVVDPRVSVLAPVVHLVSHFDGGCPCEHGRPVTLAAGGSCMPEILAAAMAPRPVLVVSDGGDWTASYPRLEYPYLQRLWGLYGAAERVENCHLAAEKHDYGANKRAAVYDFFARTLGLDVTRVDESRVTLQPAEALASFGAELPPQAIRSCEKLELIINTIR